MWIKLSGDGQNQPQDGDTHLEAQFRGYELRGKDTITTLAAGKVVVVVVAARH